MNLLLYLAEAFLIASLMKVFSYRLGVPAVSGYVVGGILLGGSLFFWLPGGQAFTEHWLFSQQVLDQLTTVTDIALGIIALSIGVELEWKRLHALGRIIIAITLFEALTAFLFVTVVIYLIWRDLPLAIILGSVSSATAPAATVAVIQQFRARGPLTSTILAVVGFDDAISLIIFAFALVITKGILGGETISLVSAILEPFREILLSMLIGAVLGILMAYLISKITDQEIILFLLITMILFISGISVVLNLSALLANMIFGAALINLNPGIKMRITSYFGSFAPVFYTLFFLISGAFLDVTRIPAIWLISIVYFFCRFGGKVLGASVGGKLGGTTTKRGMYTGLSLLPQVGVGIALALVIHGEFGEGAYGDQGVLLSTNSLNILLVTTLLTEFIGPYLTKISLMRAGEIRV